MYTSFTILNTSANGQKNAALSIQQKDHTVGTEKKVDEKEQALSSTYSTGVALPQLSVLKITIRLPPFYSVS